MTDSELVCIQFYEELLQKLISVIVDFPAELKVFRSTNAGKTAFMNIFHFRAFAQCRNSPSWRLWTLLFICDLIWSWLIAGSWRCCRVRPLSLAQIRQLRLRVAHDEATALFPFAQLCCQYKWHSVPCGVQVGPGSGALCRWVLDHVIPAGSHGGEQDWHHWEAHGCVWILMWWLLFYFSFPPS